VPKIYLIITGGTIDSYTTGRSRDALLEHSAVPSYLKSLKLNLDFEFAELFMKDSREITAADREKILQAVELSDCDKVIITHGSFTIIDTAKFLKNNLKRKNQTVILTGSMKPLKFENSDAPTNLNFALAQLGHLPAGVYITFNDRVLDPEFAVKNLEQSRFEDINDK